MAILFLENKDGLCCGSVLGLENVLEVHFKGHVGKININCIKSNKSQ